jgi:hypothetical protein
MSGTPAESNENDHKSPHNCERDELESVAVSLGYMAENNVLQAKKLQCLARELSEACEKRAAFLLQESADSIDAENSRLREAQAILIRKICS